RIGLISRLGVGLCEGLTVLNQHYLGGDRPRPTWNLLILLFHCHHVLRTFSEMGGLLHIPGFQPCLVGFGNEVLRRTITVTITIRPRARYDSHHHQSRGKAFHQVSTLCHGFPSRSSGTSYPHAI